MGEDAVKERQDRPHRTTLTELSAAKAPTRKQTLTDFPKPPALPAEHAATVPSPVRSPMRETIRRPTPPSAVALARRTDPPAGAEPPPTSIRVPADENAPGSLSGDQTALLRDELARVRAQLAESEREKRVQIEAKQPGPYQPPLVSVVPPPPTPASVIPDGTIESLRKAQTKAWLGLAALMAVLAVPLYSYIDAQAKRIARLSVQTEQANSTATGAKEKAGTNATTQRTLEQQFRQKRANDREVWRLLGVVVPKTEGDPEPENLSPMTPYCAPGKVCPGPQIVLGRAP